MEPSLYFMASLILRFTLVAGLALIVIRLGRSLAASLRYEAVLMGMVAAVVLPVLMLLLPSWRVLPAVPQDWYQAGTGDALERISSEPTWSAPQSRAAGAERIAVDNPVGEAVSFALDELRALSTLQLFLIIWAAGFLVVLSRSIHARWTLSRWWTSAGPIDVGSWDDIIEEAGDRVFLTREVQVRQMGGINSPMTWGVWRPRLLLPVEAADWSRERKLNALMHEFVHVRRRDAWHDVLSALFVALFWFHPLAWMLRQQLLIQREASCDDAVLDLGANPQEYAQMLIDVAKRMKGHRAAPRVAMTISRPSQLEGRILSVLDTSEKKRIFRPVQQRMLAVGWVGVLLVISAMSPAGQPSEPILAATDRVAPMGMDRSASGVPTPVVQDDGKPGSRMESSSEELDGPATPFMESAADTVKDPIEDFLAVAGIRMADAALSELGRTVAEVDWTAVLQRSGIDLSGLEISIQTDEPEEGQEAAGNGTEPLDAALDRMSTRIETAVILELENVIRLHPGTDKARRAMKALIEIDSPASRDALDRLDIRRLPR